MRLKSGVWDQADARHFSRLQNVQNGSLPVYQVPGAGVRG